MNIYHPLRIPMMFLVALSLLPSCTKDHSLEIIPVTSGNIILTFTHKVNGNDLKFDTMRYATSLGNSYAVSDLMYFVSDISLHLKGKEWCKIQMDNGIHYIDAQDNYSCSWWVTDHFPAGTYDTVAFTFGLNEQQNITGLFPNPPERDMSWPVVLGGGYHYMMLDLKWKNASMTESQPFNFHLGIGQMYDGNTVNTDSIIGFIQNYFRVTLPCQLTIAEGKYQQVIIQMNVDKWFDGPYAFDFASYPNGIMQDQEGMFRAAMNGRDAFSINIPK